MKFTENAHAVIALKGRELLVEKVSFIMVKYIEAKKAMGDFPLTSLEIEEVEFVLGLCAGCRLYYSELPNSCTSDVLLWNIKHGAKSHIYKIYRPLVILLTILAKKPSDSENNLAEIIETCLLQIDFLE